MRLHKCDGLTSELLFGSLHTYVINNPYIPRVVMHPKFVAALYEQDIALLHLDEELVFSASVLPICLPPPGAGKMKRTEVYGLIVLVSDTGRFPYLGRLATLTGWGRHWDKGPLADGYVPSIQH